MKIVVYIESNFLLVLAHFNILDIIFEEKQKINKLDHFWCYSSNRDFVSLFFSICLSVGNKIVLENWNAIKQYLIEDNLGLI